MTPIIIHLDMNSYFASVQQQDNPLWRGKVLGVCEHLGGILIAASIEAKRWGIKTGTPVWEAKKLYPKIIITHTHPDRYRLYNQRLVKVVSDYTDKVERYSIDEVFLDITKCCNVKGLRASAFAEAMAEKKCIGLSQEYYQKDPWEEAVNIAQEIKRRMKKEVGDYLTCSVGIAENKLLAKIGSDLKKPDGLVIVTSDKLQVTSREHIATHKDSPCSAQRESLWLTKDDLYQRLQLTDVPGIGHRQERNLNELGIKTLPELKNYPKSKLLARFGVVGGHHLYNMGQLTGSWKDKVQDERGIKSIGHMYTLPAQFREPKFFTPVLYKLCEMVGRRLRRQNLMGNILHFYLAGGRHEGFGKSKRLGYYLYDGREIFLECVKIFESLNIKQIQFKLIGITVAGLTGYVRQLSLFGTEEKHRKLVDALDRINEKYGDFTVCRVPILAAGKVFRDSIGFGRLKEMPALYSGQI